MNSLRILRLKKVYSILIKKNTRYDFPNARVATERFP